MIFIATGLVLFRLMVNYSWSSVRLGARGLPRGTLKIWTLRPGNMLNIAADTLWPNKCAPGLIPPTGT